MSLQQPCRHLRNSTLRRMSFCVHCRAAIINLGWHPLVLPFHGHLIIPIAHVLLSAWDPDKWYDSYVALLVWLYSTWESKPFSYMRH